MSADPSRSPRPVGSRELRRGHGVLRDAVCATKFYIFFEKCKWFFGSYTPASVPAATAFTTTSLIRNTGVMGVREAMEVVEG